VPPALDAACRLLGVTAEAHADVVRAAYRALAKRQHPDRQAESSNDTKQRSDAEFIRLTDAFELVLKHAERQR
jgi:DnaJ-class molecular chaperone